MEATVCDNASLTFTYALIGTLPDEDDELARYTGLMKAIKTGEAALDYAVQVNWSMMGSEAILCVACQNMLRNPTGPNLKGGSCGCHKSYSLGM